MDIVCLEIINELDLLLKQLAFILFQEHFSGAMLPGFGPKLCLQLYTWIRLLIGTHNEKVPLTKLSDKGDQHKYRLVVFRELSEQEELGRFLVGLAGKITNVLKED